MCFCARNYRNLSLALILALLASANLVFHLAAMGVLKVPAITPLYAGLGLIVMIECVMTGRVIPAFTMSVTPGLKLVTTVWIERLTLGATGLGLALWVFAPPGGVTLTMLAFASLLHVHRLLRWHPWVIRNRPILWILHASYAWFPVGLALLALAQTGLVVVSAGVHALAVGATGGLIIGMITRTARGHTDRPLKMSAPEVLAYALVLTAAVLRVLLPLVAPSMYVCAGGRCHGLECGVCDLPVDLHVLADEHAAGRQGRLTSLRLRNASPRSATLTRPPCGWCTDQMLRGAAQTSITVTPKPPWGSRCSGDTIRGRRSQ